MQKPVHQNGHLLNDQAFLDSITVVISPGVSNSVTVSHLEAVLKSYTGVRYNSFCPKHNIFFITVDKTIYNSAQVFYTHLKNSTNISSLLLKEGNPNDILSFCETPVPETIQEIEAKKALLDK